MFYAFAASMGDKGKPRPNEDSFAMGDRVFVVADGLGSTNNAHEASRLTAEGLVALMSTCSLMPDLQHLSMELNELSSRVKHETARGKSTAIALWFPELQFSDTLEFWGIAAGDSRLYTLVPQTGELTQLSVDQSVEVFKRKDGRVKRSLTASFGGYPPDPADRPLFQGRLRRGEWILLMTDGAWEYVEKYREWFVSFCVDGIKEDPQGMLDRLVEEAQEAQQDDATILLFMYT